MNLADLSIKRPIFITSIVLSMLVLGYLSMRRLGVDLFPDVTFPIVTVTVPYPGAGPTEVETLVARVLEDELSTVSGIKRLSSRNRDGVTVLIAEFTLETDVKYAEQQIKDRVISARRKMPDDIEEPFIRRVDPADQPVLMIAVAADLDAAALFDLADDFVRPKLEQVSKVGLVETIGGRKREIRVELDRRKLAEYQISASQVAARIGAAGVNVPAGKVENSAKQTVYRTLGEFHSLADVANTPVNFLGNDISVTVNRVGTVIDSLADERSRSSFNGQKSLVLQVFRQSGANTIAVVDAVRKRVGAINAELAERPGKGKLTVVRDLSKSIRANVDDVQESILLGIALLVVVVFLFLGSFRSTLITGLALPNSLLGAFVLMAVAGFTINVMTLLALSLAVGLLIDDAIVVRENIFRHIEEGMSPREAASFGTKQVSLAVVATTLTVIAVFLPIAFLQGVVGQFFKQFGLTICFAMAISLFDALTVAPMLSAYFAGGLQKDKKRSGIAGALNAVLGAFDRFQTGLENSYERILGSVLRHPLISIGGSLVIFFLSLLSLGFVPKTFLPPQDFGEFMVSLEMVPGTSLQAMSDAAAKVDAAIRSNREVATSVGIVGNRDGEVNQANFFLELVPRKQRKENTSQVKARLREQLKEFAYAAPVVKDIDIIGGGSRPFSLNIVANDLEQLDEYGRKVFAWLKNHPGLTDVEYSQKPGKPEFQVALDPRKAELLGVSTTLVGAELRTLVEGQTPAVFREHGREYDIRVRLREDQRELKDSFSSIYVPNMNQRLIRLDQVGRGVETTGPASIFRQDRGRSVQIGADVRPGGPGLGGVIGDIRRKLREGDLKLPAGMNYGYVGQAESFQELTDSMIMAAILAVVFIYLVLASLYESFVTPFTIMLVLPLAACGAFLALFVTHSTLDMFSMIGCIMLLGVATKNSILLVDYANQKVLEGMDRNKAVLEAGRTRLRPILMTTLALIAGMLPVAIGLNEASKQRTSMGIAVIGGLITSTLLSLVVVPAAYAYIDRFRVWSRRKLSERFMAGQVH